MAAISCCASSPYTRRTRRLSIDLKQSMSAKDVFCKATLAGGECRIQEPSARSAGYRHYAHKRNRWSLMTSESLTTTHGLTPCCSRPIAGSSSNNHNCTTVELHSVPQPSPRQEPTAPPWHCYHQPAIRHPLQDWFATTLHVLLGEFDAFRMGFCSDRWRSKRRRRSSSRRTGSATNLLRFFSAGQNLINFLRDCAKQKRLPSWR